jgi:hypothetical protein
MVCWDTRLKLIVLISFISFARYALERTPDFIKVWFWSRSDNSVPSDVKNGALSVETDRWVCNHSSRGERTSKPTDS